MWEFHSHYDGFSHRWLWKYFFQGVLSRFSGPDFDFNTMSDAVGDAKGHGFEMHMDRWQIMPSTR